MQVRLIDVSLPEGLWKVTLGDAPGQVFQTNGGLYAAMDLASAYAMGSSTLGPSLLWTYDAGQDIYTAEV
jgi:hypothetical protein